MPDDFRWLEGSCGIWPSFPLAQGMVSSRYTPRTQYDLRTKLMAWAPLKAQCALKWDPLLWAKLVRPKRVLRLISVSLKKDPRLYIRERTSV